MGAATSPPVGAYVRAFSVMSERTTGSSQSPSYWHRSDQSRHHVSVSSMAPSGDLAGGSGWWE